MSLLRTSTSLFPTVCLSQIITSVTRKYRLPLPGPPYTQNSVELFVALKTVVGASKSKKKHQLKFSVLPVF